MMTFLDALILGVVEGLTEFLPVSSTGHLVLASRWLALPESEFLKLFEVVIQLGAILAVLVLYGRRLFSDFEIIKRVGVAFLPTAILGVIFYKIVKLLLGSPLVVIASLFFGGVALILFEQFHESRDDAHFDISKLSLKKSFVIGLFQSLAMIPGVSRSAATILGGLSLGIPRAAIVEFSFLLAVPTIAAAAGLDLLENMSVLTSETVPLLLVGLFVSFAVALISIKTFLRFITTHNFTLFGVYRIIFALVALLV